MTTLILRLAPRPLAAILALIASPLAAAEVAPGFAVSEAPGLLQISDRGRVVFGWQRAPLAEPKGGEKFAASAFIHQLTTPSGFSMTDIQPSDHLHHLGVWWPWKHVEVDGRKHNCWELQNGEGRHRAISAGVSGETPDKLSLLLGNRHEIKTDEGYREVIAEKTALAFSRLGEDAYQLDIEISQSPAGEGKPVVAAYRYSGFSWRGPAGWSRDNSRLRTSGGHDRDNANHQAANWLMIDGETPQGRATMLILSAAAMDGGEPELLRVWGSNQHHGAPFVNFNPVVKKSLPIKAPAVAQRRYRLVIADREITPAEADERWKAWENE